METQKYYTPTIVEFHVGFEYEEYVDYEWVKKIVDRGFMQDLWNYYVDLHQIRVKCLDEQDILELGWVNRSGYYECYLKNYYKRENVTARLFYEDVFFNEKRILSIEVGGTGLRAHEFSCVYYGSVNNKSELKKIMQMLGISE